MKTKKYSVYENIYDVNSSTLTKNNENCRKPFFKFLILTTHKIVCWKGKDR